MTKYRLTACDSVLHNILVPGEAWISQMALLVDEEVVGGLHRKSCSQWLDVQGGPLRSGVLRAQYWEQHYVTSLPGTWTAGLSAPLARLLVTPGSAVPLTCRRERIHPEESARV